MERALAAIHQANHTRVPLAFEYDTHDGLAGLFLDIPNAIQELVTSPITANYPSCSLVTVPSATEIRPDWNAWSADLDLVPDLFPILRHSQFEDLLNGTFADPISSLLRTIKPDARMRCRIQIVVTPTTDHRRRFCAQAVKRLDREFFHRHHRLAHYYACNISRLKHWIPAWLLGIIVARAGSFRRVLDTSASRLHDREDDLIAANEKVGGHLFDAFIRLIVQASPEDHRLALDRIQQMAGAFGTFTKSRLARFRVRRLGPGVKTPRRARGFLLSHEELATLFHPPTATAQAEKMSVSQFSELEAPTTLPAPAQQGTVTLGRVRFRDDERPVTLGAEDRRRHVYIVGKTGMGKTTLLENMLVSDMENGHGVCLVDPHGDLADAVVGLVPKHRTNDAVLFDAASRQNVVRFNPLACIDPLHVDRVTSGAVSAFKKLHDASWGPRLEDTLRNAVFATVEHGGTLMDMMQLLGDRAYRERTVPRIKDDVVRGYFLYEFASWSSSYRIEAVAAIQNKIRPFLTNTNIRAIVSQPGPSLDLRSIMDSGKILIVNLSKGRMGEDNSMLLGSFLVTSLQQAAMTRADQPEAARRDFFLYVDEFQNFTTGSFATVLSEARKFRLNLVVAHQYLSQLDRDTAAAVWGNIGSIVAFQVGSDDAVTLSQQLGKHPAQITPENLAGLPKYTAYARLLIDGMPSNPFSMQTLPPRSDSFDAQRADTIRRTSQRRHAHAVV